MKAFLNLSIIQKLAFPIVISVAVTAGVAWYAKQGFQQLAQETSNLVDRSAQNRSLIMQLAGELDAAIIAKQDLMVERGADQQRPLVQQFRFHLDAASKLLATLVQKTPRPERKAALNAIGADLQRYLELNSHVIDLVAGNDMAAAPDATSAETRPLRIAIQGKIADLTRL
jgi:hypothetical protein